MINKVSIYNGVKYSSSGIFQSYLVFISAKKYIKYFSGTTGINSSNPNGMSEQYIENIIKSDSNKYIYFLHTNSMTKVFKHIFYTRYCLFGSVKLTKNTNPNKYKYSDYGIGFDSHSELSFTDGSIGKNIIIFGADMTSYVHIDNKNIDILILGEGRTKGLGDTTLTAEAKYLINFTQLGKRFALSLHYNGSNSFLFVNATKIYQFKAKESKIKDYILCLGNILKDFTINNMKKAGLK